MPRLNETPLRPEKGVFSGPPPVLGRASPGVPWNHTPSSQPWTTSKSWSSCAAWRHLASVPRAAPSGSTWRSQEPPHAPQNSHLPLSALPFPVVTVTTKTTSPVSCVTLVSKCLWTCVPWWIRVHPTVMLEWDGLDPSPALSPALGCSPLLSWRDRHHLKWFRLSPPRMASSPRAQTGLVGTPVPDIQKALKNCVINRWML